MKHRDFHNAAEGAANIARFLGWLAALPLAGEIQRQLTACADWLHTLSRTTAGAAAPDTTPGAAGGTT
jgi:hypothetical protein